MLKNTIAGTQHIQNLCYQYIHRERFGYVIVRTYLQPLQLILYIDLGRQQIHRYVAGPQILFHRFAKFDSIHNRHHNIRKNQVYVIFFKHLQRLLPVLRLYQIKLSGQTVEQIPPQLLIVFHYKNCSMPASRLFFTGFCHFRFYIIGINLMRICRIDTLFLHLSLALRKFLRSIHRLILRNINGKRRAFSNLAHQRYLPVMQFNQTLNQRQSDAASFVYVLHLIKTFENLPLLILWYAHSRICYLQNNIFIFSVEFYINPLPFFRILKSIG